MIDFLQKGIKARGLACELRGLLEDLHSTAEDRPELGVEDTLYDLAAGAEETEAALDEMFPLERYPTTNPSTWRKDK